jgi:hypothetical protein
MLIGSRSRSSHGPSRWVCSALAQLQQVPSLHMARQDSQNHASSRGIAQRSVGEETIWCRIRASLYYNYIDSDKWKMARAKNKTAQNFCEFPHSRGRKAADLRSGDTALNRLILCNFC